MYTIFLSGVQEGMKFFGERTGALVNAALLTIVYFFGIGMTNILSRVFGKKFLELNIESARKSYWVNIGEKPEKIHRYYRQF